MLNAVTLEGFRGPIVHVHRQRHGDSGCYNHWTWLRSIDSHDLTRVRPILDATHESSAYRILEHIIPLRGVTLVAAQETIVKARLPERRELLTRSPYRATSDGKQDTIKFPF